VDPAVDPGFREGGSPGGLGSVVVIEESPCPRGPIYKSLSLDHKVLEIFKDFTFCKLSIVYDKNSVTAIVHEDTVKNVLLTDVRYYLLIYVSKSPN